MNNFIETGSKRYGVQKATIKKCFEAILGHYWLIEIIGDNNIFFWLHDLKFGGMKTYNQLEGNYFIDEMPYKHTVIINGAGRVFEHFKIYVSNSCESKKKVSIVCNGILEEDEDLPEKEVVISVICSILD